MTTNTVLEHHLTTTSPDETSALGRSLASVAGAGDLICLWGELGAGKTHLAKAVGAGLGVRETIVSPSFILMAEYPGRLPLFHLDLFRLTDAADVIGGGLVDDRQTTGVTLVEWPDRMATLLPKARLDVVIEGAGEDPRHITIRAGTPELQRYLDVLR